VNIYVILTPIFFYNYADTNEKREVTIDITIIANEPYLIPFAFNFAYSTGSQSVYSPFSLFD
jgi:hypothetical protein